MRIFPKQALTMNSKKPLIGITLDYFDPGQHAEAAWYSQWPWYALRYRYCEAVVLAGGVPLALSYYLNCIDDYAEILDGLVLTGGGFDIDPKLYGDEAIHPTVKVKPNRTEFEMAIARRMLDLNKPVLGICGGMQLLNVLHKGTLYQDLPSDIKSDINHSQTHDRHLPQHQAIIEPDTFLAELIKETSVLVNSVHHQSIKQIANGFQVNAKAPDGIIEGIESSNYKFCLGVQWHPEFHVTEADKKIFTGFVNACFVA